MESLLRYLVNDDALLVTCGTSRLHYAISEPSDAISDHSNTIFEPSDAIFDHSNTLSEPSDAISETPKTIYEPSDVHVKTQMQHVNPQVMCLTSENLGPHGPS